MLRNYLFLLKFSGLRIFKKIPRILAAKLATFFHSSCCFVYVFL